MRRRKKKAIASSDLASTMNTFLDWFERDLDCRKMDNMRRERVDVTRDNKFLDAISGTVNALDKGNIVMGEFILSLQHQHTKPRGLLETMLLMYKVCSLIYPECLLWH